MGRILEGLCRCGAWGCFDEFNRLEEGVLSSISSAIVVIQSALGIAAETVTLPDADKPIPVANTVALFVTMNPGCVRAFLLRVVVLSCSRPYPSYTVLYVS